MQIQLMTEAQAKEAPFNPFDVTKVWPHADYPLIDVGILELNRIPQNYFAEVEQVAFSPANLVPGVTLSPDKMLVARAFSYPDAHRHRPGVNYNMLAVNRPLHPANTYHRDGAMNDNPRDCGERLITQLQLLRAAPVGEVRLYAEPPLALEGAADRYDHRLGNDDYTQAGNLFRLLGAGQQQRLFINLAESMLGVPEHILSEQLRALREGQIRHTQRVFAPQ